ncbi:MAG: hypothetical protein DRR19_20505 [Candidatus Parabeggiatoa sp. nov. 1]|nr:MAG: hypothetical protein DRR19_20505 [Gammaproteobacteria bacterium]
MSINLPLLSGYLSRLAIFLVSFPSAVWKYLPHSVWRAGQNDSACLSLRLWWLCGRKAGLTTQRVRANIPLPRLGTRENSFLAIGLFMTLIGTASADLTPPNACFEATPTEGTAPLTVTLEPSCSDDSDGTVVQYDWSIDGQPISLANAATDTKTISFDTAGTFTIVLKVTDNDGLTAQTQGTVQVEGCTSQINPTSRSHDSSADSGSVDVNASTDCNWTAKSNTSWATITAGSNGQGNDIVMYSVMGNPSTQSRSGTLTIAGWDFTLNQAGIIPPTNPHTLILTNHEKLAELYGATDADKIISKLNELATHSDVQGLVIPVENDATVAAAIAKRGNNYDDETQTNAVAETIKQLILNQWNANLENVVIVGDDRVVPFYRLTDGTSTPDTWTLTDDFYTDRVPTSCSGCANPEAYIADIASGRLIETPSQMIDVIDTFLADNTLNIDDAAVTGYDFVQDGAQAQCNLLQSAGLFTDCALIGEHWTSDDFNRDILNTYHDVTSINGQAHYDLFGAPSGYLYADDFSGTSTDFAGTLFYTLGCHAGQNVPDELDLPESLAILRANYIANTGYGWGYTGGIGLSEELMWNLTNELLQPKMTLGKALINAKQQYFADNPAFGPYDEKIMTESTLYGLPMYQVQSSATPPAIGIQRDKSQGNDAQKTRYTYTWAKTTPVTVSEKTFYSLNGKVAGNEGEPILPKFTNDVSRTDQILQGVVFRGGSYTTVDAAPPLQSFKTTTGYLSPDRTFNAPGWYPSIFFTPHTVQLNAMRKEMLVVTAGQYHSKMAQQRLFDDMVFYVYYSASASSDWTVPTVSLTDSRLSGDTATVTVTTSDASGIKEVVVAYTDGKGTWKSVNLTGSDETWTGEFAATADTEFFIQSVDKIGNVAVNDNDGQYFKPEPEPEPELEPVYTLSPVYRFWSETHQVHFFTISEVEKDVIIADYPEEIWRFEEAAYYAYSKGEQPDGTSPIYRFWSDANQVHFFTISEVEKDAIIADYPEEIWRFEGVAYYAYEKGKQPEGASAVHRFWSDINQAHFFTVYEAEKDAIIANSPEEMWRHEGIAWYAYQP